VLVPDPKIWFSKLDGSLEDGEGDYRRLLSNDGNMLELPESPSSEFTDVSVVRSRPKATP
jgi:hypothetical protein